MREKDIEEREREPDIPESKQILYKWRKKSKQSET